MAKNFERERAQQLRQGGWSLKEIATFLKVCKGTVSYWCRDIRLSPTHEQRLAQKSHAAGIAAFHALAEQKKRHGFKKQA